MSLLHHGLSARIAAAKEFFTLFLDFLPVKENQTSTGDSLNKIRPKAQTFQFSYAVPPGPS